MTRLRYWLALASILLASGAQAQGTFATDYAKRLLSTANVWTKGQTITLGTITADQPFINGTATWNNSGVTFTGVKYNATDTASAAGSLLMDLQVGGSSKAKVTKAGAQLGVDGSLSVPTFAFASAPTTGFWLSGGAIDVSVVGASSAYFGQSGFFLRSSSQLSWSNNTNADSGTYDLSLYRDAANTLAQRNSTAAQAFRVYGSYTDSSNYERSGFDMTTGGQVRIVSEQAGTGAARDLAFRINGASRWIMSTSGHLTTGNDNGYNIGAVGATRPANVYVGTSVVTPKLIASGGTTPTMGACGTSPAISGNDSAMLVTVGTGGSATSCAVTFAAAFAAAPVCIAQNNTDQVAYSMVTTTTTLTISAAAAFTASSKFHVHCIGI